MPAIRTGVLLAFVSFALHFVWESWHVGLYTGYDHWTAGFPVVLLATMGDTLYTLAAFALASAFKRSVDWVRDAPSTEYLMLVTLGFLIALFVEYKGLALERWEYLPAMPIIPVLGVGLSPVLEMTILLPLTFLIAAWIERKVSW